MSKMSIFIFQLIKETPKKKEKSMIIYDSQVTRFFLSFIHLFGLNIQAMKIKITLYLISFSLNSCVNLVALIFKLPNTLNLVQNRHGMIPR